MARLSTALALLATAHAFTGPLAPRAPHKNALVAPQQKGVRNWLTKLKAAVADPAPVAAETKQDRLAEYVAAKGGTRVIRRVRRAASAKLRRRARYERRERCATPKPLRKQIAPLTHPRTQVLIANNGMAATKSIMSMRRWAYLELGDERALEFIVMATPEDLNANAEFVRLADEYVEVPGGSNTNNYANVKLIVDTAARLGVDAVWPGWGHASENPKLPRALKEKGIAFMGPPAPVMSVLGDKIAANILAQTAKVPSIPWSGSFGNPGDDGPLQANLQEDGTIPRETFEAGCVHSAEEALAAAERVQYPVMLKASEGGGGKGIRMCKNAEELSAAFPQVENEQPGLEQRPLS